MQNRFHHQGGGVPYDVGGGGGFKGGTVTRGPRGGFGQQQQQQQQHLQQQPLPPSFSAKSCAEGWPRVRKMSMEASFMLEQLERGVVPGSDLPSRLSATLNELRGSVCVLENLLARENPSTRPMWQTRLYEMKNGLARIQNSFQRINAGSMRHARWKREQAELFGRSRRVGASPGQLSAFAAYADEKESLASSSHMVSQMTELTGNIMSSLSGQRDKLKGAHKRVLDIANSLGVSDKVLRMIEKRDFFDKLIVYGGILVTLCVFFGLLYVFRWR